MMNDLLANDVAEVCRLMMGIGIIRMEASVSIREELTSQMQSTSTVQKLDIDNDLSGISFVNEIVDM